MNEKASESSEGAMLLMRMRKKHLAFGYVFGKVFRSLRPFSSTVKITL